MRPESELIAYQRTLFELLNEFVERATGSKIREFTTLEHFDGMLKERSVQIAQRAPEAYGWVDQEIRQFYVDQGSRVFGLACALGGLKLVQGGSTRFQQSQINAVRSSLLYADTILIPDPVLPWLESRRQDERFRAVHLLRSAFSILHLRPLVDADLDHPAVLVFRSWEKLLEENDPQTQEATKQLMADVVANFVDPRVETFDDVLKLVATQPEHFLAGVDKHRLFVGPGGSLDEPLKISLERYEKDLQLWRTPAWLEKYAERSIAQKVLNGVAERLQPQFHLLENAAELNAHALLSLEQQAHYFRLVATTNATRLNRLGVLGTDSQTMIDALGTERFRWLSNVPMDDLVELRQNNENAAFRKRLESAVRNMHDALVRDTDRVAAELAREISSAIADHERAVRDIEKRYSKVHGKTAVGAWTAFAASMIPSLAPFLGIAAPLAVATKYVFDKLDERSDTKTVSKSLMGVLVRARDS